MKDRKLPQDARERVLDAAEKLFAQRGYNAVTLRDIATEVGINHTSLYHHVPGGKEDLFVEVTERHLQRHRAGITNAAHQAGPEIQARLYAIADWLLSQPPIDLIRMTYTDMPAIEVERAGRLAQTTFESLLIPIEAVLREAGEKGEISYQQGGPLSGGILGMIESLFAVPEQALPYSRQRMAHELIDIVMKGLWPRGQKE